jgi:CDP-diacylglycerol--glycerol-3-phosphate 3-phosphatidyltransferase
MTLPNKLTVARLIMVPIFVVLLSFPSLVTYAFAYVVFVAATITDYYDGKIARERNLITNFGKLLDPVADKILVTAAFVMFIKMEQLDVPGWCVVAILGREFLVTGARSLAASEGTVVGANVWGKVKAVLQMIYLSTFLALVVLEQVMASYMPHAGPGSGLDMYRSVLKSASFWGVLLIAAITLYSGAQFARMNWSLVRMGQEP